MGGRSLGRGSIGRVEHGSGENWEGGALGVGSNGKGENWEGEHWGEGALRGNGEHIGREEH